MPNKTPEAMMREIDDLSGKLNTLLEQAVLMELKTEVIVDKRENGSTPYLIIYLWRQVEPK